MATTTTTTPAATTTTTTTTTPLLHLLHYSHSTSTVRHCDCSCRCCCCCCCCCGLGCTCDCDDDRNAWWASKTFGTEGRQQTRSQECRAKVPLGLPVPCLPAQHEKAKLVEAARSRVRFAAVRIAQSRFLVSWTTKVSIKKQQPRCSCNLEPGEQSDHLDRCTWPVQLKR